MGEMGLWTHGFCGSFSVGKAAIFGEDSVSPSCPRTPNPLQDLKSEILNKRVIQSDFCGPFFKATGNSKISPLYTLNYSGSEITAPPGMDVERSEMGSFGF